MRNPTLSLPEFFYRMALNKTLLQTYEGIKICDPTSTDEAQQERFRSRILEALTLIQKHDPRRF